MSQKVPVQVNMQPFIPNETNLQDVITKPAVRAAIYGAFVVLIVVAGATSVAYATLGSGLPSWLMVTNQVLTYLGVPVGGLALANTPKKGA